MTDRTNVLGIKEENAGAFGPDENEWHDSKTIVTFDQESPTKRRKFYRNGDSLARKDPSQSPKKAKESNFIIVGVDFGTTYSGVAHVTTGADKVKVKVIKRWSGSSPLSSEKVPTRLAYHAQNAALREDGWGDGIPPGLITCQWFKLLLDESTNQNSYDDPLLRESMGGDLMRLPPGKNKLDVTTDFLRFLYKHTMNHLASATGRQTLEETPVKFQLTVPATWSVLARDTTRTAATRAGFGTRTGDELSMVDEPEAAAVFALKSQIETFGKTSPFQVGTSVLVVDMGGGTVDLVTYKITRTTPLRLNEACVGEGGKCGGTTIDRNLHKLLTDKFGPAFSDLPLGNRCAGSKFMNYFEEFKRKFNGPDPGEVFPLPLKMIMPENGIPESYDAIEHNVLIRSEELADMFEPVLEKTFELVQKQIQSSIAGSKPAVKTIVLCGGLGSSEYVEKRLQQFIEEQLPRGIQLVSPTKRWSAIARGAAIQGLEKSIVLSKLSKAHFGICVHEKFDAKKHSVEDRVHFPGLGFRAVNQMRWHVELGEKITASTKHDIECFARIEKSNTDAEIILWQEIFSSNVQQAPSRLNNAVKRVGRVTIDLTDVVEEQRRIKAHPKDQLLKHFEIPITIHMKLAKEQGYLTFTAKIGKKKAGEASVKFVADHAE